MHVSGGKWERIQHSRRCPSPGLIAPAPTGVSGDATPPPAHERGRASLLASGCFSGSWFTLLNSCASLMSLPAGQGETADKDRRAGIP
jgi:hypothetical protein